MGLRQVAGAYIAREVTTVRPDVQQYREWMHTVLSFSRNTLSNI